jgi:hypothetical protein
LAPRFRGRNGYVELFAEKVKTAPAKRREASPARYRRSGRFGRGGACPASRKQRRGDTHKSFSKQKEALFKGTSEFGSIR